MSTPHYTIDREKLYALRFELLEKAMEQGLTQVAQKVVVDEDVLSNIDLPPMTPRFVMLLDRVATAVGVPLDRYATRTR